MIDCAISNNQLGSNKRAGRESDFSLNADHTDRANTNNLQNFQTFNSNPIIRTSEPHNKQNDIPELDEGEETKDNKLLVIGFDNAPVGRRPKFSRRTAKASDVGSGTEAHKSPRKKNKLPPKA